jgi:hypothetical protein
MEKINWPRKVKANRNLCKYNRIKAKEKSLDQYLEIKVGELDADQGNLVEISPQVSLNLTDHPGGNRPQSQVTKEDEGDQGEVQSHQNQLNHLWTKQSYS